jgi:hypothetical protein
VPAGDIPRDTKPVNDLRERGLLQSLEKVDIAMTDPIHEIHLHHMNFDIFFRKSNQTKLKQIKPNLIKY